MTDFFPALVFNSEVPIVIPCGFYLPDTGIITVYLPLYQMRVRDRDRICIDLENKQTNLVTGRIIKIDTDGRKILVRQRWGTEIECSIASECTINRDGEKATLDKLRTGDWARIEKDASGKAIKIEARDVGESVDDSIYKMVKVKIHGSDFIINMQQNSADQAQVRIIVKDKQGAGNKDQIRNKNKETVQIRDCNKQKERCRDRQQLRDRNCQENKVELSAKNRMNTRLTGSDAADFIDRFIDDANISVSADPNPDKVVAVAEKILNKTIDKNQVKIEIKIRDGEQVRMFKY